MKFDGIRPVGHALIHAKRRTDGRTDGNDEANRRFSRLAKATKMHYLSIFKIQWHLCLLIAN